MFWAVAGKPAEKMSPPLRRPGPRRYSAGEHAAAAPKVDNHLPGAGERRKAGTGRRARFVARALEAAPHYWQIRGTPHFREALLRRLGHQKRELIRGAERSSARRQRQIALDFSVGGPQERGEHDNNERRD